MGVVFHAHNHTYLNDEGLKYISVTTLIKKYTPPFDNDYWSSYKALKDILSDAGVWQVYKERAGGWEQVLDFCRKIKNFPYRDSIIQRKRYYLDLWKEAGEEARERGTAFHNKAEAATKGAKHVLEDLREVDVHIGKDIIVAPDFKTSGIYPELLLYNHKYRLAGTADWVLKDGNTIHIKDYKTSKEITMDAFQESTLLSPLNHLPNANYYTYSLQLSIYAWMLECKGYKVGKLCIEHVKNEFETKIFPVQYLRREVHTLLNHYAEHRKTEGRQNQPPSGKAGAPFVFTGPASRGQGSQPNRS